ncbi:MAG: lipoyl(octanoyl) transferase LipB [Tenuifilaceae bacterium]|jgi:lipoyl(octanoyl) transferase|nr:lipoyl(octanoyl) transferase LipB [Tenuifilaceae bacterium]
MQTINYQNLGLVDYKKAWDYQEELFANVLTHRDRPDREHSGYLLFCEHPHVYTLGKSGHNTNLLISDEMLKQIGATYYHINRGGDITYHGPGQIVAYPILDLEALKINLKEYIHLLEEVVIKSLEPFGISASRLENATGVWLDVGQKGKERKICAIGVRASRFVTMHGLAFNVNTNLNYFNYINPCGFVDKGVTSMQKELGKEVDLSAVQEVMQEMFGKVFDVTYM